MHGKAQKGRSVSSRKRTRIGKLRCLPPMMNDRTLTFCQSTVIAVPVERKLRCCIPLNHICPQRKAYKCKNRRIKKNIPEYFPCTMLSNSFRSRSLSVTALGEHLKFTGSLPTKSCLSSNQPRYVLTSPVQESSACSQTSLVASRISRRATESPSAKAGRSHLPPTIVI
jgi:hypothetical protein